MSTVQDTRGVDTQQFSSMDMAVAILVERIQSLPKEAKQNLFDLAPDLASGDPEVEAETRKAFLEILRQSPVEVRTLDLEDKAGAGSEIHSWKKWVGGQVQKARTNADFTQQQLADLCGIQQAHLSKIENGLLSPSSRTLEKIANGLGLPMTTFDPSLSDCDE